MSHSDSKGRLTAATRLLQTQWEEARQSWRDRKAQEFQESYLAELDSSVSATLKVMEELERLLQKVHADCD